MASTTEISPVYQVSSMRVLIVLILAVAFSDPTAVCAAGAKPFAASDSIDLVAILPPPPANNSPQTRAELAEILTLQVKRTPQMVTRAQADAEESVWRFADVIGPKFTSENLPRLAKFFDRVTETEGAVVDPAKNFFKRMRPYAWSDLVKPVVQRPSVSGAWPSGHATVGTLMGIILSNMVPEKKAQIMARAWEYADNRVVSGVHYRSDIEMGRIAGSVIAAVIMTHDDFNAEFASAKVELRAALGL